MKLESGRLRLAATDLANHLACRHKTTLERGAAESRWKPPDWYRPEAEVLAQRGLEHERAYLAHLEAQGRIITRLDEEAGASAIDKTLAAMRAGAEVIAQATLASDRWLGRADVLVRIERPSRLGAWSYEALDTKLAQETKGGAILQLCLYSELLKSAQGVLPEHMYVVPRRPDFPLEKYRVEDYLAYYQLMKRKLEAAADAPAAPDGAPDTYPEPVPHCEICRWWPRCDKQRRADDHLSFVAGLSRLQSRELRSHDVATLAALAAQPVPIPWKPARGAKEGYVRVREQARVQLEGREQHRPVREMLSSEPGRGLAMLPPPSPGDVFLDLEGDPYVEDGGLEYLFGWAVAEAAEEGTLQLESGAPRYHSRWALSRGAEKRGFEALMDAIMERWRRDPNLHIYHYGTYEPAAIKRLMGRHASRETEVDQLLRAERFVDLHAVVRQSLRASIEEYSIKQLEPFFGFSRERDLERAKSALRSTERALELGSAISVDGDEARVVEAYNRDDCLSAQALRDWLEGLRAEAIAGGAVIERPADKAGEASEGISDRERRTRELAMRLLEGLPEEPAERSAEQGARWLLAHLLEWYRREEKAPWWEFYRLRDLTVEDLLDEPAALAGLEYVERVSAIRVPVDRYRFPAQETRIRAGRKLRAPDNQPPELATAENRADKSFGEVVAIDFLARTVDIKKTGRFSDVHPISVFEHDIRTTFEQADSLLRLGDWVAEHGMDSDGAYRAARDLLLGKPPRIAGHAGGRIEREGEDGVRAARRIALELDHGTLAIQGPPGSGKTFTGARMIVSLMREGKRVGVCAQSHKVITNLLQEVVAASIEAGGRIPCAQRIQKKGDVDVQGIEEVTKNEDALSALRSRRPPVLGGTAWMWAREEFFETVDVLFVDEAGQMSLANVLAIAQSAHNLVLLGDPQQLEQPIQGTHPEGAAASALEHVLAGAQTIPDDRGLFLEETWRLPPPICALTSDLFYERRLESHEGLEAQALIGDIPFAGTGLWFVPVPHDANRSASSEEVDAVSELVRMLTDEGARWRDRNRNERPLTLGDVLVIAPYNAQVADLQARLPQGARVGTVDRFQGQEAPVVIYSMTSSSPEDAPRGMEFLYNPNRFNVATSRARCACILVGSPRLFEPDCQSPRQIHMANAFCRYKELAAEVPLATPAR